jgi:hypothetical protein
MQVKTARKYPAPFYRAFKNKTGEEKWNVYKSPLTQIVG